MLSSTAAANTKTVVTAQNQPRLMTVGAILTSKTTAIAKNTNSIALFIHISLPGLDSFYAEILVLSNYSLPAAKGFERTPETIRNHTFLSGEHGYHMSTGLGQKTK
jgi:hypothetical protein